MRILRAAKLFSKPEALNIVVRDVLGAGLTPPLDTATHLSRTMRWLCCAQDACDGIGTGGGVSAKYDMIDGWAAPYPETTGYIIPTFFNYSFLTKDREFRDRAVRMADWEMSVQLESGAFPGGFGEKTPEKEGKPAAGPRGEPTVFNTGQVIFGLSRAYLETKNKKYGNAVVRAADWLVQQQDGDGAWRKFLSPLTNNPVHAYDARTAWSLLKAAEIVKSKDKKEEYTKAAEKNADWAVSQQLENGWFENAAFNAGEQPILHTIAYTVQGVLEIGIALDRKDLVEAAKKTADRIVLLMEANGAIRGAFDKEWNAVTRSECLTGNAQMSVVWIRLHGITGNDNYFLAAKRANRHVKCSQNAWSSNHGICGGVKGSQPVTGSYMPLSYPNWAAKFFADALMMEGQAEKAEEKI